VTDGGHWRAEFLDSNGCLRRLVILPEGPPPRADGNTPSRPPVRPSARPAPARTFHLGISYDPPAADLFSNDPVPQAMSLEAIAQLVAGCTKCRLCEGPPAPVPGKARRRARLVVVGEGPGRVEDETGRPFVGPAGELLTKILGAIELPRERSSSARGQMPSAENRLPQFDEIAAVRAITCSARSDIVKPKRDPRDGGTARADAAQIPNSRWDRCGTRAPVPWYSPDRDLSSGCPAPQPELEETDLG